jgi:hypothetical protein
MNTCQRLAEGSPAPPSVKIEGVTRQKLVESGYTLPIRVNEEKLCHKLTNLKNPDRLLI